MCYQGNVGRLLGHVEGLGGGGVARDRARKIDRRGLQRRDSDLVDSLDNVVYRGPIGQVDRGLHLALQGFVADDHLVVVLLHFHLYHCALAGVEKDKLVLAQLQAYGQPSY